MGSSWGPSVLDEVYPMLAGLHVASSVPTPLKPNPWREPTMRPRGLAALGIGLLATSPMSPSWRGCVTIDVPTPLRLDIIPGDDGTIVAGRCSIAIDDVMVEHRAGDGATKESIVAGLQQELQARGCGVRLVLA